LARFGQTAESFEQWLDIAELCLKVFLPSRDIKKLLISDRL